MDFKNTALGLYRRGILGFLLMLPPFVPARAAQPEKQPAVAVVETAESTAGLASLLAAELSGKGVVYSPKDYTPGKKMPLIFFMRGMGGNLRNYPS